MNMIEKVARAIAIAEWGEDNCTDEAWRELPDIIPAAKAAIKAIYGSRLMKWLLRHVAQDMKMT